MSVLFTAEERAQMEQSIGALLKHTPVPVEPVPHALRDIHQAGSDLHEAVRKVTEKHAALALAEHLEFEIDRLQAVARIARTKGEQ